MSWIFLLLLVPDALAQTGEPLRRPSTSPIEGRHSGAAAPLERVAFLPPAAEARPSLTYAPYPLRYSSRSAREAATGLTVMGRPEAAHLFLDPGRAPARSLPWRLSSLVELFVGDLPVAETKNWRFSVRVSLGR